MKWDQEGSDWPNREASSFVASGAHVWHVQRMGAGPTLLLIHGAGASSHCWRDVMPALARDFDVIAVDLPGQGFSTLGSRARCGLEAMAEDLSALMATLKAAPEALIGHSAGAAIALRMALDSKTPPKAVLSLCGVLAPYLGVAGFMFPMTAKLLALNPFAGLAVSQMAANEASVRAMINATGSRLDDLGVELYRRLVGDAAHVDATIAMMARWSLEPLLADIDKLVSPTLLLGGARDLVTPPSISRDLAERLDCAEFASAADSGHLFPEESPAEAVAVIRAVLEAAQVASPAPRPKRAAAR